MILKLYWWEYAQFMGKFFGKSPNLTYFSFWGPNFNLNQNGYGILISFHRQVIQGISVYVWWCGSRKSYVSSTMPRCPLSWLLHVSTMRHIIVHVNGKKMFFHVSMEPFLLERVPSSSSTSVLGQRQREGERKKKVVAIVLASLNPVRESKDHQRARTRPMSLVGSKGGLLFEYGC